MNDAHAKVLGRFAVVRVGGRLQVLQDEVAFRCHGEGGCWVIWEMIRLLTLSWEMWCDVMWCDVMKKM